MAPGGSNSAGRLSVLFLALVGVASNVACGLTTKNADGVGAGGTGVEIAGSGGDEATGGTGGTSGVAGSGVGGVTPVDCSLEGCAAPPLCVHGCEATCGCCACEDGERSASPSRPLVCRGGCYDLVSIDWVSLVFEYGGLIEEQNYRRELFVDGSIRVDTSSEVREAVVPPATMRAVETIIQSPEFSEGLQVGFNCGVPRDDFELLQVFTGAGVFAGVARQEVFGCGEGTVVGQLRALLADF